MYEGLSPGWGYTAIAVALLARLNPLAVVVTAIVFGALSAGGGAMQREAGVPEVWVRGIEALVILAVLTVDRSWQVAGRQSVPVTDIAALSSFLVAAVGLGGAAGAGRSRRERCRSGRG